MILKLWGISEQGPDLGAVGHMGLNQTQANTLLGLIYFITPTLEKMKEIIVRSCSSICQNWVSKKETQN